LRGSGVWTAGANTARLRENKKQMEPGQTTPLTDYSSDGIDLTLIRWFLSLTPAERLDFHQGQMDDILAIWKANGGR